MKRTTSPLPEDYTRRELETFRRAFAAGNEAGLYDALVYCKREALPLPTWALEACIVRQREFISGETKRHAKWQQQFRQDMKDMARYEMVEEIREHGAKGRKVFEYAARFLAGTENEGKQDAIEGSCKRFRRTMKTNPFRYYVPSSIRRKERRAPIDPKFIEWLDRKFPRPKLDQKFPLPKDGGPRRYR